MNTEQERAAFEAWAASIGLKVTGKYAKTLSVLCAKSGFKAGYRAGQAALEAAREDGWQPIETAPNEAWFLVHSDRGWIGLARRSDPDYAPDEGWFEDEHTEFLDPEWLTHWHPLPAPPAIDQAQGGKEDSND